MSLGHGLDDITVTSMILGGCKHLAEIVAMAPALRLRVYVEGIEARGQLHHGGRVLKGRCSTGNNARKGRLGTISG